jgi:hypothetical protein
MTDSPNTAPAEGAGGGRRAPHLALVDATTGARKPPPSERRAVYPALLRKGEPPRGWVAAMSRAWGLTHNTVGAELATARNELAASRTPEAAAALAHDLIVQASELADQLEAMARAPAPTRDAAVIGAWAATLTARTRVLVAAVNLKLRCTAQLRALYGLGKPAQGPGRRRRR